jgi:hypothetical protein
MSMSIPSKHETAVSPRSLFIRRAFLFAIPILTALVIFRHPPDPATAHDLGHHTDLYIWIHVGLLFMLPLLGILIWQLLDGIHNRAATVARLLLPVALVFYAAFDSLVGIVAGMLAREALLLTGEVSLGAAALAARWMEIPMPLPVISTIGTVSWTVTLLAAAVAHKQAGSSWIVVIGLALAGPLFGFGHPFITGVIGMAGLLAATAVVELGKNGRSPATG